MESNPERLRAKRDADLTDEERELLGRWGSEAFGSQEWLRAFTWSRPDWRLFLLDHGAPVSHLKLTMRRGYVREREVLFAGVGGVMTPRIHQRKGFSSALLKLADDFIFTNLGADYGLLFCLPELVPFYARLGWIATGGRVFIDQPQGKIVWPKAAMILPSDGARWHEAEIDVSGAPW